jgi:hypothetical protein
MVDSSRLNTASCKDAKYESKGKFIEPKKPLHLLGSGFFVIVDQRIELSNHFHRDIEFMRKYLEEGEEWQIPPQ